MNLISINKHILKNNLVVLYCHTPNTVSFEMSLHINTGARDENEHSYGISHFLEHMMFRGSKNYPNSIALAKAMESFGGEINAMTGIEHTTYWLKGDAEKTIEAIEPFANFFLYPNYCDLEIERAIILQEMASDFNEAGESIDTESLAMETLFANHPLGNSIIGKEDTVKKITSIDLKNKRKYFYTPEKCILSIHTAQSESKVIDALDSYFGKHWEHTSNTSTPRVHAHHFLPKKDSLKKPQNALCLQNNPDNQFALKIIFPTAGGFSQEVILIHFLQRILDDGICTRLPGNIREKHGLVYDISCDTQFFEEIGTLSIDATVAEKQLPELLIQLAEELKKIVTEKPLLQEIEHIKFRYCFDLKQIKETPSRLLNRGVSCYFMKESISIEKELDIVNKVTAEDILHTAQKVFGAVRRGFVLIGPKARKKRALVEKFLNTLDSVSG